MYWGCGEEFGGVGGTGVGGERGGGMVGGGGGGGGGGFLGAGELAFSSLEGKGIFFFFWRLSSWMCFSWFCSPPPFFFFFFSLFSSLFFPLKPFPPPSASSHQVFAQISLPPIYPRYFLTPIQPQTLNPPYPPSAQTHALGQRGAENILSVRVWGSANFS